MQHVSCYWFPYAKQLKFGTWILDLAVINGRVKLQLEQQEVSVQQFRS